MNITANRVDTDKLTFINITCPSQITVHIDFVIVFDISLESKGGNDLINVSDKLYMMKYY